MKKLSLCLLVFLGLTQSVFADIPFIPEIETRFQSLEGLIAISSPGAKKTVRAIWDATSGSNGSSTVTSGVHSLNVQLPAKSIITDSYFYVVTQPADASAASTLVGFQCEDSNNILAQTDMTSGALTGLAAGSLRSANQRGAATADGGAADMTASIAAACNVSAVVSVSDATAGRIILYVEYVIGE